MDQVERRVPFTDPAQVDYLAGLDKRINKLIEKQREAAVLLSETRTALNAVMTFLDEDTRVRKANGGQVLQMFQRTALDVEEPQSNEERPNE